MLRDALALTSPDAPSPDWSNPLIGTSFPSAILATASCSAQAVQGWG